MKTAKVLLNLTAFFCFLYFALYIFTLVFIPIGIYCFIAGKRFNYKAEHMVDDLRFSNNDFKKYVIFVSIFCFPFGLLAIIPYYLIVSNKIKVTDLKYVDTRSEQPVEDVKESQETTSESSETSENPATKEEPEEEKLEKFKKLENFKEKGLITEEELEQAREQLFGKKENN